LPNFNLKFANSESCRFGFTQNSIFQDSCGAATQRHAGKAWRVLARTDRLVSQWARAGYRHQARAWHWQGKA